MTGRDLPPDVQNGPYGYEPDAISNFETLGQDGNPELTPREAQKIARAAYDASTNWLNAGRRAAWADSLRAFNSRHSTGSK